MLVRIVKCSNPEYWYKNKIGEIYNVGKEYGDDYEVHDDRHGYILKEDAIVIDPVRDIKRLLGMVIASFYGDLYGQDLPEIEEIAKDYGFKLNEDGYWEEIE